jgi:hypothetical protein
MFRLNGGLFEHELCDRDLRVMERMWRAGVVDAEQGPEGLLYVVRVVKGGQAA